MEATHMALPTIKETSKYDMFQTVKGNRAVMPAHVKNLMEAISQTNLLAYNPIIINSELEVIDGQHRLEAAKRLGVPIYYVVTEEKVGATEVHLLNSRNRSWTSQDFLETYIAHGKQDYVVIRDFMEDYGFSLSLSVMMLSGFKRQERGERNDFLVGKFKVTTLKEAQELAHRIDELQPFLAARVSRVREFLFAIRAAYKVVSHEELVDQFRESEFRITRHSYLREYLKDLEEVINYGKPKGERKFLTIGGIE
jgi:hypothetical protein